MPVVPHSTVLMEWDRAAIFPQRSNHDNRISVIRSFLLLRWGLKFIYERCNRFGVRLGDSIISRGAQRLFALVLDDRWKRMAIEFDGLQDSRERPECLRIFLVGAHLIELHSSVRLSASST
jgi:hypothetical protein